MEDNKTYELSKTQGIAFCSFCVYNSIMPIIANGSAHIGKWIDKAMGGEESLPGCPPDHPQALALVRAGLNLLDSKITITSNTLLSACGNPAVLQSGLANLDALTINEPTSTLGQIIINDGTVADLLAILDVAKVEQAVNSLVRLEKQEARAQTTGELQDLSSHIA